MCLFHRFSSDRTKARAKCHGEGFLFFMCMCVCVHVCMCVLSHVQLFVTPWTVAGQTPLSVNFPQGYWSGLPFPPPGDLPNPGTGPPSSGSPASAGIFFTTAPSGSHFFSWQQLPASAWMRPSSDEALSVYSRTNA